MICNLMYIELPFAGPELRRTLSVFYWLDEEGAASVGEIHESEPDQISQIQKV
jgi:hypothetical protein